jgi:NAD(P)-dependent dehydrogenase (short-subunit alcohol dehydrogenase family)
VNVSSTEGHIVLPLLGGYQISKHALEAATATLRLEVARDGIGVTSIAPGGVDTAIYSKGFWVDTDAHPGSRYRTGYRRIKQLMALNRRAQLSSASDVAGCVLEAILSPRPRPYYLVGADAYALVATHRLMPTRAREWLHRKTFGL